MVGREKEIRFLSSLYNQKGFSLCYIFGPTKVGKTKLITEFAKDKLCLYISSYETKDNIFFKILQNRIKSFFKKDININSFEDFFIFLSKMNISKKIIIAIDNFQYFKNLNIENYIKYIQDKNILFIILSRFYNQNYNYKTNNIIFLKDLSFDYIDNFLPNISKNDKLLVYSAFSTTPEYLKEYDINKDFILNIKDSLLNKNSILFEEGLNILKKDLIEIDIYASILYAISIGKYKIGDIANFLNLSSTYLSRYMQKLQNYMLIEKAIPVTAKNHSRFGRYYIKNNFLRFWLCYIYPNISILERENIYPVVNFIQKDFKNRIVKGRYREYILEKLEKDPIKYLGFIPDKIGRWWDNKGNNIDIVAFNKENVAYIYCLYNKYNNIIGEKLKKTSKLLKMGNKNQKYIIFTKSMLPKQL